MCGEEDGRYDTVSGEWGIVTVLGENCTKEEGWLHLVRRDSEACLDVFYGEQRAAFTALASLGAYYLDDAGVEYPVQVRIFY